MFKFSFILGLCFMSLISCSSVSFHNLDLDNKFAILEDNSTIPENAIHYFRINYVDNLQFEISVKSDASVAFKLGVASFEEELDDQAISDSDSSFTEIPEFTKTAENDEDVFSYSLSEATNKEKPFVVVRVENTQEIDYYNVLAKKGSDTPKEPKAKNIEFNQEVGLEEEVETPLYFSVNIPEPITQKKISFDLKVPQSTLSDATVSVSGYSDEPDLSDLSKNLIDKKVDTESEVSKDGEYDINKYSVENIENAKYLLIVVETSSPLQLKSLQVKVYAEGEEGPGKKEDGEEGGGAKGKEDTSDDSKGSTVLIVVLCIVAGLIVLVILFFVIRKICCKPKEVTSETIEKDFSPKESNELN